MSSLSSPSRPGSEPGGTEAESQRHHGGSHGGSSAGQDPLPAAGLQLRPLRYVPAGPQVGFCCFFVGRSGPDEAVLTTITKRS